MKREQRVALLVSVAFGAIAGAGACDGGAGSELVPLVALAEGGTGTPTIEPKLDVVDVPLDGLSAALLERFDEGDRLFGLPLREPDGLGPLFIRSSCGACHTDGLRGPGFVHKMAVVTSDGSPAVDQTKLAYGHTARPNVTAGATTPIAPPENDDTVLVSTRVGPAVLGRGYMEAVDDREIERVAAEQASRSDGIRGRINRVAFQSEMTADARFHTLKRGDMAIGRFGFKARVPTLDDFTADALLGDMGITSPLRPSELPNPDSLKDDQKPGVDVGLESVQKRADYMRLIAIPRRDVDEAGRALFARAKCDVCHTPSLRTRADYPIAQLAGIDAPVYTDFLLHDMGANLADGMNEADGQAGARDWRTTPLIGLRFFATYLHDSRARSIREAVDLHAGPGSEANESVSIFSGLTEGEREQLLDFVKAL